MQLSKKKYQLGSYFNSRNIKFYESLNGHKFNKWFSLRYMKYDMKQINIMRAFIVAVYRHTVSKSQ